MSSIKIRLKRIDNFTRIRVLITHPMETGRNRDEVAGQLIPAHFINEVAIEHNGNKIAGCFLGTGISENPYFSFKMKGGQSGDRIRVTWHDNLGNSDYAEKIIK